MAGKIVTTRKPLLGCLVLLVCVLPAVGKLEYMNEEELKLAMKDENHVVVLFSDGVECIGQCEELEDTLASIREDVVEAVNAWVVRTHSPILANQYGLMGKNNGNAVVFLRNGIPLLYTGPADDDEIMLNFLVTNFESSVHSLGDANFEHLTQAASGATTGDWLVMFVRSECEKCLQLRATIEAVAAGVKNRKNVALVDRDVDGGQTTRRFAIKQFPAFLLFRQGRLYRYSLPVIDAGSLIAFATDGFRNARAEAIPLPKTAFDDYTEWCADWLRENPTAMYSGAAIFAMIILAAGIASFKRPSQPSLSSKKEGKKKK